MTTSSPIKPNFNNAVEAYQKANKKEHYIKNRESIREYKKQYLKDNKTKYLKLEKPAAFMWRVLVF